jgi:hypothetical protein
MMRCKRGAQKRHRRSGPAHTRNAESATLNLERYDDDEFRMSKKPLFTIKIKDNISKPKSKSKFSISSIRHAVCCAAAYA